jgi:predicted aldo/keto reductase-like oxidoreductase
MPEPAVRTNIWKAICGVRDKIIIQGHICTVYEDGQYKRTRDINQTKTAFEDLLKRLDTDYIDVGMIHYVDSLEDYKAVFETEIITYAQDLKNRESSNT